MSNRVRWVGVFVWDCNGYNTRHAKQILMNSSQMATINKEKVIAFEKWLRQGKKSYKIVCLFSCYEQVNMTKKNNAKMEKHLYTNCVSLITEMYIKGMTKHIFLGMYERRIFSRDWNGNSLSSLRENLRKKETWKRHTMMEEANITVDYSNEIHSTVGTK